MGGSKQIQHPATIKLWVTLTVLCTSNLLSSRVYHWNTLNLFEVLIRYVVFNFDFLVLHSATVSVSSVIFFPLCWIGCPVGFNYPRQRLFSTLLWLHDSSGKGSWSSLMFHFFNVPLSPPRWLVHWPYPSIHPSISPSLSPSLIKCTPLPLVLSPMGSISNCF